MRAPGLAIHHLPVATQLGHGQALSDGAREGADPFFAPAVEPYGGLGERVAWAALARLERLNALLAEGLDDVANCVIELHVRKSRKSRASPDGTEPAVNQRLQDAQRADPRANCVTRTP